MFGGGRREQIHDTGRAVLTLRGQERLHLPGPGRDLVGTGQLHQLSAYPEDALVLTTTASRIAELKVDRRERREHAIDGELA